MLRLARRFAAAPRLGRRFCAVEREQMDFDLVVVGAGPAGLSAAIRAKQVAEQQGHELSVCVVEKGAEPGAHILSGNVFEPRALYELFPDAKERGAPLHTAVTEDHFYVLPSSKHAVHVPHAVMPPMIDNHGNYIISLGEMVQWLAAQAEELGVEVYSGFAASQPVLSEDGAVCGVQLSDVGVGKDGEKKDAFEPGMELRAKQVLLGEGCRGSLAEALMKRYNLREGACPQAYGLGIKEVWQIDDAEKHRAGMVVHTVGWPLGLSTYGGTFMYHMAPNLVHIGMVVGLDYKNPYLSPYQEFQRFKHHPRVKALLEGGKCVSYGARVLNEGGVQALPKLTFPGGMLLGCAAGFLNVAKIKGSHLAMKTGMLGGEAAATAILAGGGAGEDLAQYEQMVKESWAYEEMHQVRNFKPAWKAGLVGGMGYGGASLLLARGREPWTFRWSKADHEATKPAAECTKIEYPAPDGKISFDILENLARSGVNHEHDQPAHLKVKPELAHVPLEVSHAKYAAPESRFCPAKVYEYPVDDDGNVRLQINAQNCVHCKCCSIKTPQEFINWTVPEGGGGPQYAGM